MAARELGILAVLSISAPFLAAVQGGPPRVSTEVALKQLVKRVEPIVPPEAAAARVGGPVIADLIVGPKGAVESVTILAGPPMLHAAAADAFRQWVFRPFLRNGRPAPALVLVEVSFPDPVRDEAVRLNADYRSALFACRREIESAPNTADRPCAALVDAAQRLRPDQTFERLQAYELYGESLFRQWRFTEAIAQLERALALRLAEARPSPGAIAMNHAMIAMLHQASNDLTKADESFALARAAYESAITAAGDAPGTLGEGLRTVLVRHAEVKRALGRDVEALTLERRADALPVAPAAPGTAPPGPPPVAIVDALPCFGASAAAMKDEDVRAIRRLLPPGTRPWFIAGDVEVRGMPNVAVAVYLHAETTTPQMRRGRLVTMIGELSSTAGAAASRTWTALQGLSEEYAQVPPAGNEPSDVWLPEASRPFRLAALDSVPRFTDAELIELVDFLRTTAAKSSRPTPGARPRLFTDLQPWTITSITREQVAEVQIVLQDTSGPNGRGQIASLRRRGTTWEIVELLAVG